MKKIPLALVVLCLIFLGCSHRNEFGQDRINFNFSRIKPNTDETVYKIIDTSKVYLEVSVTDVSGHPVSLLAKGKSKYLKFYKDGRVAEFRNIDFDAIDSFNPKQARGHLYHLKKNAFTVQVYFKHPQCGQCFIREKLQKTGDDTFELQNEDYIYTYKAMDIPPSYLIYKPDW